MAPAPTVAFSRPTTHHSDGPLPEGFQLLLDEALVSNQCRQRYPTAISEFMARLTVARRLMSVRPAPQTMIAGRYAEACALLRGIAGLHRPGLVLLDVEWHARSLSPVRRFVSRALHRWMADGCGAIQVFCEAEIDRYASYYGIEREKFVWVPFCMDIDTSHHERAPGDYLFTGGILDRDYPTLFSAVRDLPVEVRVAGPLPEPGSLEVPANVRLLGQTSRAEYLRQIAGSRMVVLSLNSEGSLRFPGVITYCAAMHLGRCVVLNEPVGSRSYIEPGVHGLVVPPRDPVALESAIRSVLDDPAAGERLGRQGRERAKAEFTTRNYFGHLQRVVDRLGGASGG